MPSFPRSRRFPQWTPRIRRGKFPWITKDGDFDPTQFPIDSVLKQALSDDDQEFRSGLTMLDSMYAHGRTEAGVFLMGLLVNCDDNWERRIKIVESMRVIYTKPCADLLFGELRRVKSSNTTRRYLTTIIEVLADMPPELIEAGFEALAETSRSSQKMRDKFRAVLGHRFVTRTIGESRRDELTLRSGSPCPEELGRSHGISPRNVDCPWNQ